MARKFARLKWRARLLLDFTLWQFSAEGRASTEQAHFMDREWVAISSQSDAEFFGVNFAGRPYLLVGASHYGPFDTFELIVSWIEGMLYVGSDQYVNDLGREADETLLSYAL